MKLIRDGLATDAEWQLFDPATSGEQSARPILPLNLFLENTRRGVHPQEGVGVQIGADTDISDLAPHLSDISLIVLEVASFADGRSFSIAHRLRNKLDYHGEIWAAGGIFSDQYALAIQCGIDAVLVDDGLLKRQPIEHWQEAFASAPVPYRNQADMAQNQIPAERSQIYQFSDAVIKNLNAQFDGESSEAVLAFVVGDERFGKPVIVSSFGAGSSVLLHMVANIAPQLEVMFIDTGKLFSQTIAYRDQLVARLGLGKVTTLRPDPVNIGLDDENGDLWQSDDFACCELRKVKPLNKALSGYDTWISGRKSFQNDNRSALKAFERSGNHIKINPLHNWSQEALDAYMARYQLPAHPLATSGYTSIGCAPCTTPVLPSENPRAGRWRNSDKTECGIHLTPD